MLMEFNLLTAQFSASCCAKIKIVLIDDDGKFLDDFHACLANCKQCSNFPMASSFIRFFSFIKISIELNLMYKLHKRD